MAYILTNQVSGKPTNGNVGYNNSWLQVENNANRDLFAQASYVTNFEDFTVSLSAGDVNIGSVEIKDGNSGLRADVVDAGNGLNALRVINQDLESSVDDITIGDKQGRFATVDPTLSALNVKVTNTVPVSGSITVVNPVTSVHVTNTVAITGSVQVTNSSPVTYADTPSLDAFGRLRISNPISLFDSKSIYDDGSFFWNSQTNGGTDAFQANDSSRVLTVGINQYFVKETYRRFGYQPGKSQMFMNTGILEAQLDVIKRTGMFRSLSANNYTDGMVGIYFQAYDNGAGTSKDHYAWVINNASNLVPSQSATQATWNLDKMDGSGPSGITLDFSKSQIFLCDFEWLGVGRVRCGFNVNGKTYYCHEFLNANNINGTYMINPNLPLRHEIRSAGGVGSMKTICSTVISEGGTEAPAFVTRSVSLSASINPDNNTRVGLLGIRLRPDRLDAQNEIVNVEVFPQINAQNTFAPFKWELVLRPTPATGVNWVNQSTSGSMQYAYGNATLAISGGTIVASGFGNRDIKIELNDPLFNKCVKIGRSLDLKPDELWVIITYFTDHQPTWASMTWGETD